MIADVYHVNPDLHFVDVPLVLKERRGFQEDLQITMILVNIHHYNN